MQPDLGGVTIAVLGGDAREQVLVKELAAKGARVKVTGLPIGNKTDNISFYENPVQCIEEINALILPVPGINKDGCLYSPLAEKPLALTVEMLRTIPTGVHVFVGIARPLLVKLFSREDLHLTELMNLDEVAILNSIPTAEGALQMAMEMMNITIHGSSAFVLGFGRTGITLARLLGSVGARTRVVARKPDHLARICEMNLMPVPFNLMVHYLGEADIIFNTVPALVLTGEVLKNVSPDAIIIDLASAPGGTDFGMAEKLGIKAVLAPGLPGKVAPKTAGQILARVITRILVEKKPAVH